MPPCRRCRHRCFFVEASRRRGCALPPLVRGSLPSSTVRCPPCRYCCLLGLRRRHGALPPLVRSPLPSLAGRPLSNALARHGPGPKLRRWCQFRAWATPCRRKNTIFGHPCPVLQREALPPPSAWLIVVFCVVQWLECREVGLVSIELRLGTTRLLDS